MGLKLNQSAAPSTPASSKAEVYLGTDGRLRIIKPDGSVMIMEPYDSTNYLINSGFTFAQRQGNPVNLTTYSSTTTRVYAADRWGMVNENASIQYQRINTLGAPETNLTAQYYGKFKKITSNGKIIVSQVVESYNAMALRGRVCRFQAKMKFSVAGSMSVRMAVLGFTGASDNALTGATLASAFGAGGTDPTWGTNLTAIAPTNPDNCTVSGLGATCVLSTSWQRFSACFTIPTNVTNVLVVFFSNSQLAANDELNISECMLLADQTIAEYVPVPIDQELAACQRYYQKTFDVDTGPAQSTVTNLDFRWTAHTAAATANRSPSFRLPTRLRKATSPVVTLYNPSVANAQIRDSTAAADCSASAVGQASEQCISFTCTANAATVVGGLLSVNVSIDSEI